MKTWKILFLGTASVFAVTGAQAADLPVKAKPVQYVKICSLYGEGFYYIPGTDTCIRIGGYVRADYYWGGAANGGVPFYSGANGHRDRTTAEFNTRHRANISIDTRTQTAYGNLRTFESIHIQNESGATAVALPRAFIQWTGFTFGHSQSFTDIFTLDSYQFGTPQIGGSTDGDGINLVAYTAEFGNGFAFTAEIEERRKGGVSGKSTTNLQPVTALTAGSTAADNSIAQQLPDFGGVLTYKDKWGNIGVFAMGHDASAAYYSGSGTGAFAGFVCAGQPGTTQCGHPGGSLGWAGGIGGTVNLPWIAPGDRIGAQFVYSVGAAGYAALKHNAAGMFGSGNEVAVGWLTDGVYVNGSSIELTTAWSVVAAYEHNWTPQLKTAVYGAFLQVDYNTAATNLFLTRVCPTPAAGGQTNFNTVTNCNPDYGHIYVGTRTQWSPVKNFLLGIDVMYTAIDTGFSGLANLGGGISARPTGVYTITDQNDVTAIFRAQSSF